MSDDWSRQIGRYFDDDLSRSQLQSLEHWLTSDTAHMQQFIAAAMLHDRLHGSMLARGALSQPANGGTATELASPNGNPRSRPRRLMTLGAIAATIVFLFLFWRGSVPVQAWQTELQKVIAANSVPTDRTYAIEVESHVVGGARQKGRPAEDTRPPKPPLDGAKLYVHEDEKFLLERTLSDGRTFITGSDGVTSWMIPPEGAVRVSSDLHRFNRDMPGHEYSMSLSNLSEALNRLGVAFEVNVLPIEYDDTRSKGSENTRLLVATKKRGFPGPRRVEITYLQDRRLIEQMRFIDMPYGSDRLTVRVTLVDTSPLADDFFKHSAHHAADQTVITE